MELVEVVTVVTEVLIALLAVIGGYFLLRTVSETIFLPRRVTAAVVLTAPVDAAELDILLAEATRHPARRRGMRVLLVLHPTLMVGDIGEMDADGTPRLAPAYATVAERYRAAVCIATLSEPAVMVENPMSE